MCVHVDVFLSPSDTVGQGTQSFPGAHSAVLRNSAPGAPKDGLMDLSREDIAPWIEAAQGARLNAYTLELLGRPIVGSDLKPTAVDPFRNMAEWCRGYLEAAADHLMLWADSVAPLKFHPDVVNVYTLRPTLTLARAAMEAAAQAVWILGPDDPARRAGRYILLATADLQEQARAAESTESAEALSAELEAILTAMELAPRRFTPPRYLHMLRDAAAFFAEGLPEHASRPSWMNADRVERLWRAASGAAHGKMWPDFEFTISGDMDEEGRAYAVPDHVAMGEFVDVAASFFAAGVVLLAVRSGRYEEWDELTAAATERLLGAMTRRGDAEG